MAWRKLNNADNSNPNNTLVVISDWGGCCDQTAGTLKNCVVSAHNLTSSPLDTIVIDGVSVAFTESNTVAELEDAINAAMASADYFDVNDPDAATTYGTLVSGDASAAYIRITTTATLTKFITSGDTDVNFVCTAI